MVKCANYEIIYLCISDLRPKEGFKKKSIILLRKSRKSDMNKTPDLFIRSLTRLLNNKVCFYAEKQYVSASFLIKNDRFLLIG